MGVGFIACDLDVATVFRVDSKERMICRDENSDSAWIIFDDTNRLLSSFDYSLLDPIMLSGFFGAGFTIVGVFILFGKVVGSVMQTVKRM